MFQTLFPGDLFAELDRLQRQMRQFAGPMTSIRGFGRSAYPALNVGSTADTFEIYAFAPGLDPATVEATIDRGVLTLAGERKSGLPAGNDATVHLNERFAGRFSRAVSLSDDADPDRVTAKYADGVLHVSVRRRETSQRRRIAID
ncbi:MAG: Hsp20/alpha crystallin family protein [Rhodocyclaceae bacterium]|nr:Hsp20/alpha crystallin family protein [Rhodocyclaceae bacterium]MBX3677470.1 Hsp20/alpha crystallin family protein [Rhodocyclaceae bacterium]MCO5099004.1 Hsp20/alpha crystallin family protein [Rhodocyclaceae bacterium]